MKKEEKVSIICRPFLRPIGIIQGLAILGFLSSPFIWIWHSWDIACKVGLTSVITICICYITYQSIKKIVGDMVDEDEKTPDNTKKSKWQKRLEEIQQARQKKLDEHKS